MHREISHADGAFEQEGRLSLYLLTALIGVLILADVIPLFADEVRLFGRPLRLWSNEYRDYRIFALCAAILGGARTFCSAIDSLMQGRIGADLAMAIAAIAAIFLKVPLVAAEIVFVGML